MDISVVIPMYGCRKAINELYDRLTKTLSEITLDYEIIMVNDCCPQNSWEDIQSLCQRDNHVVGINLSRNFGQHKAILAGLDVCEGEEVVVMDCDLQDRPEHIKSLHDKLQEGYDVVWGKRVNRKDSKVTVALSKAFYAVCNLFTDKYVDSNVCNFSIARKKVIKAQCEMREANRDFSFFQQWLGFNSTTIELEADERFEGKSSYSLIRRIRLACSIITSQSNKPLYFSIYFGVIFVIISLAMIVYSLINYYAFGDVVEGWTSLMISIYLVGGIVLLFLGNIGIYIGNIFEESKHRPLYVISDILNAKEDK